MEFKINDKSYKAKLGLAFLELATVSENKTLQELFNDFEQNTLFIIPKLIRYSIINAGNDIELNEVYDWLDEVGINDKEVTTFIESFTRSIQVHFPPENSGNVKKQKK